jgi:hypothetical protein
MLKTLIFASALSLFMAGNAVAVTVPVTMGYEGVDYDVTVLSGTWLEHQALLSSQLWWGDYDAVGHFGSFADAAGLPDRTSFAFTMVDCENRLGPGATCPRASVTDWRGTGQGPRSLTLGWGDRVENLWAVATPTVAAVPLPAAGWLFMSALIGLMGKKRLSRRSVR